MKSPPANLRTVPTLEDVAHRASVSTATVSRCLNAPHRVTEATRTRVMKAVRDLGYAPNFGAQALAAKRTNTFGAIIPTMENAIFARGLQAFQEALIEEGVTLLVASSGYCPDAEEDQIRTLLARGADALLLIGHDRTPESYAMLERRGIPHVVAWAFDPDAPRPSIGFDNRAAMTALVEAVLDQGHRDIAFISAHMAGNDRARLRVEGARAALAARGVDPGAMRLEQTTYSFQSGAEALGRLMQDGPRPTAVLCGNDVLAAGAMRQARRMGLSVPADLSITGFDDIELCEVLSPALTTMHVPHREMGRRAARLLLDMRAGVSDGAQIRLDARIKWRETLGPAPGVVAP